MGLKETILHVLGLGSGMDPMNPRTAYLDRTGYFSPENIRKRTEKELAAAERRSLELQRAMDKATGLDYLSAKQKKKKIKLFYQIGLTGASFCGNQQRGKAKKQINQSSSKK